MPNIHHYPFDHQKTYKVNFRYSIGFAGRATKLHDFAYLMDTPSHTAVQSTIILRIIRPPLLTREQQALSFYQKSEKPYRDNPLN